jgi:hypothetical protein
MKNIKISLVAALVAMICIAANAMFVTTYYIHSSPGVAVCSTVFTGTVCPPGNGPQCMVMALGQTFYICKITDGGACQIHYRPL